MNITEILERKWVIPAAVGVVGTACGFTAGYFLGRRNGFIAGSEALDEAVQEEIEFVEDTSEIIEDTADQILSLVKEKDPELEAMIEEGDVEVNVEVEVTIEEEMVHERPDPTEDIQVERVNVFPPMSLSVPDWNEAYEQANREEGEPYIIHRDTFIENENEWEQETLTYYEGDDIMADQQDQPIYNYAGLTGNLRWGHGSGDARVVYIRNEGIRREWEILRHSGSYEIEVTGLNLEHEYEAGDLKHSKVLKFRDD